MSTIERNILPRSLHEAYQLQETRVTSSVEGVVRCVLCGSGDVRTIDQFSFKDLRQLYFETCELDISTCLDQPYDNALVYIYECQECGLEFYPGCLRGNAKLYEALARFDYYYMVEKWEFGVALEDIKDSRTILEIGCGNGLFLDRVTKAFPGKEVMGLELNPDALRICRQKGLAVQTKTIEEFSDEHANSFDVVCGFQVLEHVVNPHSFLESAFRCLRDGGLCLLTVPNPAGFTKYAVNDFGNLPPHHLTRWTVDVMKHLAARYGLRIKRILEEPVAEYHKQWYRDTLMIKALSVVPGLKFGCVERGTLYRMVWALCRRLQVVIPRQFWRYSRYPGHSLYVAFRKADVTGV